MADPGTGPLQSGVAAEKDPANDKFTAESPAVSRCLQMDRILFVLCFAILPGKHCTCPDLVIRPGEWDKRHEQYTTSGRTTPRERSERADLAPCPASSTSGAAPPVSEAVILSHVQISCRANGG